ncbi:DMT family transporter [Pyrobaculum calidifontis]|uniref:EamA domain-containing protein n=1 Tax=Pyrobaculum calidifontis (strain DSM 21063 / JCM 11548 / VA1) TaxID=410359 RepID=A3MVL9_PYRCJ|nr:DMT family transporter [Pyrobaculum calidifontis]ABO08686.1 protein of unknown function DUF6, transmembrane [Pyrobaculum calidifontis JCM 11548]
MKGLALALFSVAAWSTNYVAGRRLAAAGADPLALSLVRFVAATPIIFALARAPPYRGALAQLAVAGLLGVAAFNTFLYTALHYMTAAAAALFVVLAGPATSLIEAAAGKRRPNPHVLAGGAAAVAGAYLVLAPQAQVRAVEGPLLAAAATLSWSLYTVYVRRVYARYSPAEASAWISLVGTAELAPLAPLAHYGWLAHWETAAWVLYVAAVPGALAYTAWNTAVREIGPQRAAAVLPLMPVITTAISAAALGEAVTPLQAVGMALAVAGVYYAQNPTLLPRIAGRPKSNRSSRQGSPLSE